MKNLKIKDSNGVKVNEKPKYKLYAIFTILAYLLIGYVMFHTYAYIAYNPLLSFSEALSAGINDISHGHPIAVPALPASKYFSTMLLVGIIMVIGILYFYITDSEKKKIMREGSHGTMKFNDDLDEYNMEFTDPPNSTKNNGNRNFILTDKVFLSADTRQTRRNNNVLVVGGSGSGKTRYFVKPNLCQMPKNVSFICTDPAGDLMSEQAKMLEDFGYKIKCFNLVNMDNSNKYNPLDYIKTENDVIMLVDCIMENTADPNKKGGDDFWEKAMKLMLQAFIFLLWLHGDELGLEKNFEGVMSLLDGCMTDDVGSDDATSLAMSSTDQYFAMIQYGYATDNDGNFIPDAEGYVQIGKEATPYPNARKNDISVKQYRKFKSSGTGKTFGNMLISAAARFSVFDIPTVTNLTSKDDLEIDKIGLEKTALFITLPQDTESFNFLAAILYTQLFQTLYYEAGNQSQGNYIVEDGEGEIVHVFEIDHKAASTEINEDGDDFEFEEIEANNSDEENADEACRKKSKGFLGKRKENKKEEIEHSSPVIAAAQSEAAQNEEENQVDDNPGDIKDTTLEARAKKLIEDLKNVKIAVNKKGDTYALRFKSSETGKTETIAIYRNKEQAYKKAKTLKECSLRRCGLHLPFHTRFYLDEFANIGKIPNFTRLLATMRKYEISCAIILQNLAQIKTMYDKDWSTIIGNCDTFLLLGSSELETQEYVSKKLGKTTIKTESTSEKRSKMDPTQYSVQEIARELMLPEEVGMLESDEAIVMIRGLYPFRGKKYQYERHPNYEFTADKSKDNLYNFKAGFAFPTMPVVTKAELDEPDERKINNKLSQEAKENNNKGNNAGNPKKPQPDQNPYEFDETNVMPADTEYDAAKEASRWKTPWESPHEPQSKSNPENPENEGNSEPDESPVSETDVSKMPMFHFN